MMSLTQMVNYSLALLGLLLACLGLFVSLMRRDAEPWTKRYFIAIFAILTLYTATDLTGQLIELYTDNTLGVQLAIYLESLLSSMLTPLLTFFLLRCCGEDWRRHTLIKIVVGLWLVYFVLLGVTQFTTAIYYFTPDQVYHRGPLYPLLLVPPIAIMLVNLIGLIRRRDRLSRRQFVAFLVYLLVPMLSMLLQIPFYGLYLIVIGTSVAAMCMLLFILWDGIERSEREREENARQRASIMVLQMRPHFVYNTMTSIYYLCQQDPQKAQQVILDFTSYLRKNFTAIAREDTISFAEELEHTRAYLAVEQVRFEGRLFVEIDTPHTAFRVPPLTLQPIVENAVKHGVSPELKPLHLAVRTREAAGGSEIVVEDTGPGFAERDDSEPHIALANIRERLAIMCGGKLEIAPRPGGGTSVTVFVPRGKK